MGWSAANGATLAQATTGYTEGKVTVAGVSFARFLMAAGVFLIMFFRFSVIISHLRDDNIALAQRVAILEFHIQSLRNHEG